MKKKVSEYIAELLIENGIKDVFSVVGGGAMHLNDAFGNNPNLRCTYNHHEQASAIAAESYARINNMPAVTCVTTGPGGTNAITGVLCAWQDNIPMIVLSGQVRYNTTIESSGLNLRQFGEQEHDIVKTVKHITKYATMIKDAKSIKYHIEKAIYLANNGRKGPCWLDIPLDVQGAIIEIDDLESYIPAMSPKTLFPKNKILEAIKMSKRPVILAGSAIRTAGAYEEFLDLINKLKIPVVASTSNADILSLDNENYFGNFGVFGGRCGNFIIQNADCIISLGCRLSFKQIGFNYEKFSPNSKKIVVDIDISELDKSTTNIDIPVFMDVKDFIREFYNSEIYFQNMDKAWILYCRELRTAFPIFQEKHRLSEKVNPYYFSENLKSKLSAKSVCVVGNSCACVAVLQSGIREEGQRLWGNVNCGTMGYDLPAAIGASIASKGEIICVTGDGSIQMNIQELQTIVSNKLPIKIFIFNNFGYRAIVQTQNNFFGRLSGCNADTGVNFPSFEKLAYAYNIPYYRCENNNELDNVISEFLNQKGYGICELIESQEQTIEPKVQSKSLPDGKLVSPPIDDLAPFLDVKIYKKYADYFNNKEDKLECLN